MEPTEELPDPLRDQAIRAVGALELRRQAGPVLRSIRDGDRLVGQAAGDTGQAAPRGHSP